MNIAVIFGGPAPEHDVSILTGLQTTRELVAMGKDVTSLYWSKSAEWFVVSNDLEGSAFVDGAPKGANRAELLVGDSGRCGFVVSKKGLFAKAESLNIGVVVNCCHGGPGEDGSLQATLDLAQIPYTGPNVFGAALGMDKLAFGAAISAAGLPSLPRRLVTGKTNDVDFEGPYLVKPRFGGSSIGIEVVDSVETARALCKSSIHLRNGAVIEPYRPNSLDLNVGVRVFPEPQLSAIEKPIRKSASSRIYGYEEKYIGGEGMVGAARELPAIIQPDVEDKLREYALVVAEICGLRGVQRLDFLLDGEDLFVNEINTIPGSHSKHLWVNPDVKFATLLSDMIDEAMKCPSTFWNSAGADGSALRSAGSISAKLM